MKKLIVIVSPLFVRNYIETDALREIIDQDTFFICSSDLNEKDKKSVIRYGNFAGVYSSSSTKSSFFIFISLLLMHANRKLNKGFYLYFKKTYSEVYFPSKRLQKKIHEWTSNKIIQKFLTSLLDFFRPIRRPLKFGQFLVILTINYLSLTKIIVNLYKYLLPSDEDLKPVIDQVKPDLVLIPNGGLNPVVNDIINLSNKKHSFKTMLMVDNWDNLCSKSRFVFEPDFFCVWGEQAKGHALKFHGIEESRVFLAGTPRYDVYYEYKHSSNNFKEVNFPYILFAGCWPPFDEISVLERLNALVDKYKSLLPNNCKILYRPHPWGANYDQLDFLRSKKLKNVEIDPQMSHKSRPENWLRRTDFQPDLNYYPIIIGNSEFIICPLSTMIIEGSIMNKKVLGIAYDDGQHVLNPAVMFKNSDYFERLSDMTNILLLHNEDKLESAFHDMIVNDMPLNRKALSFYIVDDKRLYPERIKDICSKINSLI
jgi:hypothetical protein